MESEEIEDKLIAINYKRCYVGVGDVTEEEAAFMDNNTFICTVTEETKDAGYDADQRFLKRHLEVGVGYELLDMDVGQSNSSVRLKEFPDLWFNSVNFEYSIKGS